MDKINMIENLTTIPRNKLLASYWHFDNDLQRCRVVRLSQEYHHWYIVTHNRKTWELSAHLPDDFVQAVSYRNGKIYECFEQI